MNDVMGIVYTNKDNFNLRELTANRAVAALPVAGRYRIIDFTISNLVNSGVRNVGIIAQKNYHSLMDHLGSGKEWDLHTRNNGLFILPPYLNRENGGEYSGLIDALRANFDYLRRSRQTYVIVSSSDYVCNTSFEPMIEQHIASGADITMMYVKVDSIKMEFSSSVTDNHTYLKIGADKTVEDIEINPNPANYPHLNANVFIIKRTLLIHLIDQAVSKGLKDFESDVLRPYINSKSMKIMGYEFEGFFRRIEAIKGYFKLNQEIIDNEVRKELFSNLPVYTKTRDDAPTVYRKEASVKNSLIADGCIIEGEVENCVLFRGVQVGKGVKIKNCIVMQDCKILEGAEMEYYILDKDVTVLPKSRMISKASHLGLIGKGTTV